MIQERLLLGPRAGARRPMSKQSWMQSNITLVTLCRHLANLKNIDANPSHVVRSVSKSNEFVQK